MSLSAVMTHTNRKPLMNKHRRKVLDLLEFILELEPNFEPEFGVDSVFNVFARRAMHDDRTEFSWVTDEQWSKWLQDYAKQLLEENDNV